MKNSFWVDKIVFLWYNDVAFSPYRRKVTKGARLTALYARIVHCPLDMSEVRHRAAANEGVCAVQPAALPFMSDSVPACVIIGADAASAPAKMRRGDKKTVRAW